MFSVSRGDREPGKRECSRWEEAACPRPWGCRAWLALGPASCPARLLCIGITAPTSPGVASRHRLRHPVLPGLHLPDPAAPPWAAWSTRVGTVRVIPMVASVGSFLGFLTAAFLVIYPEVSEEAKEEQKGHLPQPLGEGRRAAAPRKPTVLKLSRKEWPAGR